MYAIHFDDNEIFGIIIKWKNSKKFFWQMYKMGKKERMNEICIKMLIFIYIMTSDMKLNNIQLLL